MSSSIPSSPRPVDHWVTGGIVGLAAIFYAAVFRYAINVPHVDDYLYIDSIRRIVAKNTPFAEVIRLLVEQHNDHRILLSRLVVLADYWAEGQVNYRTLTLLGSLSVAGLMAEVYRLFRQANIPTWMVLPVALLLFQPSYQQNVWWVFCVLQHTLTLLLTLVVFRWLMRPETSAQVGALALGGLVLYSNSNGLFMWIAGLGLLVATRRWRWLTIWTLTGLVLIGLYFGVDYNFIAGKSLMTVGRHPDWVVKSVVSFGGSALYFDGRRWLLLPPQWVVLGMGLVVLLVVAVSWLRAFFQLKKAPLIVLMPFLGIGFVLICSGLVAALVRSEGNLMIIDRYQLFAVWCLIIVYVLVLMQVSGRRQLVAGGVGLGLAGWFWLNAWLYYGPQLTDRYNRQVAEAMALTRYQYSVASQPFGLNADWQRTWVQALQQGIYQVPDLPEISGVDAAIKHTPPARSITTFTTRSQAVAALSTNVLFIEQDTLQKPDFLFLQSAANWYVLPALHTPKPILKPWRLNIGVKSEVLPIMLRPGTYRLGWLRKTPYGWSPTLTRQEIEVPDHLDKGMR